MKTLLLLLVSIACCTGLMAQGTETFTNITTTTGAGTASSYATRVWTGDNNLQWTAIASRIDQTLNGPAAAFRNGSVSTPAIPNGIGSLTFKYRYLFTGNTGTLSIKVNGNVVGTLEIPNTATTNQSVTFSNINIPGTFSLSIEETSPEAPLQGTFNPNARKAIDDVNWTAFAGSACEAPTAQPNNLTFSSITNTTVTGNFTAANPAANEYLVVRSSSSTLSGTPDNGIIYTADDVIGNGVVISRGSSLTFTDDNLTPGGTTYYFVFAVNSACNGGPLYNSTSPLTASATTTTPPVCVAPAAAPTTLTLSPNSSFINGSFTASASADGYLVVRSPNAALNFTPVNGNTYTAGQTVGTDGTVVSFGIGTAFNAQGLAASTTYSFYVFSINGFACTGGPLYFATSLKGSTTTTSTPVNEPAGYYTNASGKSCGTLKTALKQIITSGNTPRSYSSLWDQYKLTDIKPREVGSGSANVIWDIYSDKPGATDPYNFTPGTNQCGSYSTESDCYNREHSVPQSWFNGNTGVAGPTTDYLHIFPTDGKVNAIRGSYIYGEVAAPTITSLNGSKLGSSAIAGFSGPVFEPLNEYKGDVARAFLYFVTRYEDLMPGLSGGTNGGQAFDPGTFPSVDVPYLKLMIKWSTQDPVSQKEIDRNNGAYAFQGNRNPYIDRPEYVDLVWNSSCTGLAALPVDIILFGGKLVGDQVKLEWTAENELNFDRFEVERSENGTSYKMIGKVKAANLRNYTFNDGAEAIRGQRVYYRLKKVDKDGQFKYSEVFTLHIPNNTRFTVFPNPASSYMQLQMNRNVNGNVTIEITDALGKVLQQQQSKVNGSVIRLSTGGLANGTYLVKMIYNGEQYIQKVMVTR